MKKIAFTSLIIGALFSILLLNNRCGVDEKVTPADQLHKDTLAIDKYLIENNITDYQRNSSGLRYVITEEGTGYKTDIYGGILVRYVGKLLDTGEEFDTTFRSKSIRLLLNGVISGWQIGFQLLPNGSKATLYIPSSLGYGINGSNGGLVPIPANANLIFEVELLDVIPSPNALQLQKDINEIDEYLSINNIEATKIGEDSGNNLGLRYVILEEGDGYTPILQNKIVVQYVGKLLSSGKIFDQTDLSNPQNTTEAYLNATIRGWQIGFQYFKKGSVIDLYVPSGLAYGKDPVLYEDGTTKIPANSNLIFEINFLDITN